MRFSEAWLREWVDPPLDTQALADQLSLSGLEVDALEPAAPAFSGVVIGHVQRVQAHPDAAKLRVCEVDIGDAEPLGIVCGAANVAAGQRVPVATVGARLPGDFKIKRAKLRGVASHGMICSAAELGLAESADGIMVLPGDAPVGEDLRAWMALDDQCIELDLTPDRADCLSIAGVARDVGVLNRVDVRAPRVMPVAPAVDDAVAVELTAPAACPRYLCRVIRGVDPNAPTPLWMCERLRRSGLRPLGIAVDVTNYVLLELGQPMHAFDLARIDGGITVRLAHAGESLALLNGETATLGADTLVIADRAKALALAGIMGGADSAVGPATRDLLLESAFFAPAAIAGKARGYGLHTDASHRFERGVDPTGCARAMERATALLLAVAGGEAGPVVEAAAADQLPAPPVIALRRRRIEQVLGLGLDSAAVADILGRLGMRLTDTDAGWQVVPPSGRFDIRLEVDVIAELGRVHGYDRIPVTHARSAAVTRAPLEMAYDPARARRVLLDRGWFEAVTYSFVSPELARLIDPEQTPLALANPLSAELSVMRTSLWPGLLQALRQNLARQQGRVWLFEAGLRFCTDGDQLHQEPMLAGAAVGPVLPEQWGAPARETDFFDVKADVEALLAVAGAADEVSFVPAAHPALHPGQCARLERHGRAMGWIGAIHPSLAAQLDLPVTVQLFELATAALGGGSRPAFAGVSKFPSIRRDLAIVVAADVSFDTVRSVVRAAAGALLRDLVLFDVYVGEKVGPGRKSMALGLILQDVSQTLRDDDVAAVVARVLAALQRETGAELRA
ncbi:phenylalanine--tRNA ligase subunit beta [uncultured Thiohalocapsa sp.]|uniref:phenylalanine--tRNA ligase subunit beta n=1 Tax=uncultured Thiohalocapsa sp. TaxID=768990 RepID=UPI0025D47935|nr:phenylalanine--tRNA ligase subunit beta [uncultured Thiohalocapsa sp.]